MIVAKPWGSEYINPIRNADQPYLKFVNSAVFQENPTSCRDYELTVDKIVV